MRPLDFVTVINRNSLQVFFKLFNSAEITSSYDCLLSMSFFHCNKKKIITTAEGRKFSRN